MIDPDKVYCDPSKVVPLPLTAEEIVDADTSKIEGMFGKSSKVVDGELCVPRPVKMVDETTRMALFRRSELIRIERMRAEHGGSCEWVINEGALNLCP